MLLFIPRGVMRCRKVAALITVHILVKQKTKSWEKLKILKKNTCTRSTFLDNISINILKIVENIVLLILNKCRHIYDRDFHD